MMQNGPHIDIALFKRTALESSCGAADTDKATRVQNFKVPLAPKNVFA